MVKSIVEWHWRRGIFGGCDVQGLDVDEIANELCKRIAITAITL